MASAASLRHENAGGRAVRASILRVARRPLPARWPSRWPRARAEAMGRALALRAIRSGRGSAGSAAALAGLSFSWGGMVLGISFLAAPVKFQAPSLSLAVGLDVGRHVFGVFGTAELAFALLSLLLMLWSRPSLGVRLSVVLAVAVVAVQALWLLPALDERVEVILAGGTPPPAPYHLAYIALEAVKLAAVLFTGVGSLRSALWRERRRDSSAPPPGAPESADVGTATEAGDVDRDAANGGIERGGSPANAAEWGARA